MSFKYQFFTTKQQFLKIWKIIVVPWTASLNKTFMYLQMLQIERIRVFNKRREINNLELPLVRGKKKRSWFRLDHRGHSSSYINILPPWNHLQTLTPRDEDYKNGLGKITYRVGVREIYRLRVHSSRADC